MRSVRPSEVEEELSFAQKAAEHFADHPEHSSFGEIKPEAYIALRWGLGEDCVLVLRLASDHVPTNYQNIVPRRDPQPAAALSPDAGSVLDDMPF